MLSPNWCSIVIFHCCEYGMMPPVLFCTMVAPWPLATVGEISGGWLKFCGMRPAHTLFNVLLVEDAVTAAQHSILHKVVGEPDAGRESVVVSIEELGPTL